MFMWDVMCTSSHTQHSTLRGYSNSSVPPKNGCVLFFSFFFFIHFQRFFSFLNSMNERSTYIFPPLFFLFFYFFAGSCSCLIRCLCVLQNVAVAMSEREEGQRGERVSLHEPLFFGRFHTAALLCRVALTIVLQVNRSQPFLLPRWCLGKRRGFVFGCATLHTNCKLAGGRRSRHPALFRKTLCDTCPGGRSPFSNHTFVLL